MMVIYQTVMIPITMAERKRWTKQARTILDIIYTNEESLTASGIYDIARETHPNISLGTVYRNLKRLDEAGLIRETTSNGVSVYFKHPFSSAHLECEVCHSIIPVDVMIDVGDINRRTGHVIKKWDLRLIGTCKECEGRCI